MAAAENMKKLLEKDNLMELEFEAIVSLKKIASAIEADGTIILAGCLSGQCGDIGRSDDLITSPDRLFEGRVQIATTLVTCQLTSYSLQRWCR